MSSSGSQPDPPYRGRLAPSPTGHLHLGHARTFWIAQERARTHHGTLILRNDDLDRTRARSGFVEDMMEDLAWFGFHWHEGPDIGGPFSPYTQSERTTHHLRVFEALKRNGSLYPCYCSRRDVLNALQAPHLGEDEPVYPGTCRPAPGGPAPDSLPTDRPVTWRFRVPDGESIEFEDRCQGPQRFIAGKDFGDFVVWRPDGIPSYQLAVVADDSAMRVTEVVRGADLLSSTARQLLLYRSLGLRIPHHYHCDLLGDTSGRRLAKRHASLSLRSLRASGSTPEALRQTWDRMRLKV